MESGEVRNPSAYVMRSISNHDKGGRWEPGSNVAKIDDTNTFQTRCF
jgi:hypothetical protein